jgi:EAL domain-containing protein (putative c-di-GMP-specific phosphodiesterase class I)
MNIGHLHFLVAEGDTGQRKALVAMLGHLGASRITEAADGHTALRYFQDGFTPSIDIAFVELELPGMDGLELMRNLSGMGSKTRLVVTGNCSADVMFSVETLAQSQGLALLGTLIQPHGPQKVQALLGHYTPPSPSAAILTPRKFSFAEIGAGLQAGQFEPFFQPKIELATGQVKGLEVFARWRHPEHGILGPEAFIDALEHANRVDFLDWSMLEKAVEHCRYFQERGLPTPISINLDPATLAHPSFIQQITTCVQRHGVLPGYMTFEMTEASVLFTDVAFLERLVRLRMLGFGLAIDDYGTARSNLQLLARVPFTELKIDRSFVDGASRSRPISTVLSSCLGLARSLDRAAVAVGVETKQDWDLLQGLGCTYAQGYHIAKPMEAQAYPGWLDDWRQFF